jgi:hypothetical protein
VPKVKIKVTNENNQANVYIENVLVKVFEFDDWSLFDFLSGLDKAFEYMGVEVEREYVENGYTNIDK